MLTLDEARRIAGSPAPLPPVSCPLADAAGLILAREVRALLDIPHAATSAMDGWVVHGPGPWTVRQEPEPRAVRRSAPLSPGTAVAVVTGSVIPDGGTSVLRNEHARLQDGVLSVDGDERDLAPGRNIRLPAAEARAGTLLVSAGTVLTPVRAAAAAVGGHDQVDVVPAPVVRLLTTGSEVITGGLPEPGEVRDVFGIALPGMVRAMGAVVADHNRAAEDPRDLVMEFRRTVERGDVDVVVVTGGTARSRADALRPALSEIGAEILVDEVDMRPGHPVVLGRMDEPTKPVYILGLPGNPLAGFAALTTIGGPLVDALRGLRDSVAGRIVKTTAAARLDGARRGLRLLPVTHAPYGVVPVGHDRPHMMRGLAEADGLAIVPSEGIEPEAAVRVIPVPAAAERSL